MKYFILSLLLLTNLSAVKNANFLKEGESQELVCKYGYLVQITTRVITGIKVSVEQTYCESRSSWDHSCNHKPYRCKEK